MAQALGLRALFGAADAGPAARWGMFGVVQFGFLDLAALDLPTLAATRALHELNYEADGLTSTSASSGAENACGAQTGVVASCIGSSSTIASLISALSSRRRRTDAAVSLRR